jgi:hypothetical protein
LFIFDSLFIFILASSWQETFDYWLPLVIDEKHLQKALPFLQATIGGRVKREREGRERGEERVRFLI